MSPPTELERLAVLEKAYDDIREFMFPAIQAGINEIKGKQRCHTHEEKLANLTSSVKYLWGFMSGIAIALLAGLINMFYG